MDQISGRWTTQYAEINGSIELIVLFETMNKQNVVISYKELESVVSKIQNEMGTKGTLSFLPETLLEQN